MAKSKKSPFDFAVVDETQDIRIAHLRFCAAQYNHAHLWTIDVDEALKAPAAGRARGERKDKSG